MTRLAYIPNRIIDHNGIADGATVHVYLSGSTTPVLLYSDTSMTVSMANPFTVAAGAAFPDVFYDSSVNIKLTIVSAIDGSIEEHDPYNPLGVLTLPVVVVTAFGAVADSNSTGTTGTDNTAAIQSAVNYLNSIGGGTLYFPAGKYRVTSYITLPQNIRIIGAGRVATQIITNSAGGGGATTDLSVRNGSVFYSNWASNSSTAAEITIEALGIVCSNAANVGAAFYDNGGTFINLKIKVTGFKYGVIFDQSELADIDLSDFDSQSLAGVWLVDGPDLRAGNSSQFTNRISITRSQFNAGTTSYGILDDGGNAHSFTDNNYNGCLNHIRAAGVTGLKISGGEFESSTSRCIKFDTTTLAGSGAGPCSAVWIGGGAEIVPTAGQSCITAFSLGNIVLDSVYFGNTSVAKFAGAGNVNFIRADNTFNAGGGVTFDNPATNHFEVNSTGLVTNMPLTTSGNGVGYTTGAGGAVAQATSRTTGVTLNKPSGVITLFSAAGSATYATMTVTNSTVAATDTVRVCQKSGTDKYMTHVTNVSAGSFDITYATTGGTTTETPVFNFAVIKGAAG